MAYESTITEHDLDHALQNPAQGQARDYAIGEPDLVVDGMSESILSRILGLFMKDSR
jgi:hypothetical protein